MISNNLIKTYVVRDLCPDIVQSEKKMRIAELKAFLGAKDKEVRKHNNKFVCTFNKTQVTFDEEPTQDLLEKYLHMPEDFTRQVLAVEDLKRQIVTKSVNTYPYRQIKTFSSKTTVVPQPDKLVNGVFQKQDPVVHHKVDRHEFPACKNCGGRDYIDCVIHYTCKNCAVVRDKIHEGIAYREMRDRETDMNGRSMEINTLYSDSFSRKTQIVLPKMTPQLQHLQICNDRLQMFNERLNGSRCDTQIFTAREKIDEICSTLRLSDSIVNKAHVLFCKHRRTVSVLRSENATIAACIFYALPEQVKPFKRKKKELTPWNDSKKRRLKIMNLKKPLKLKTRRKFSISYRSQKKAI